MMKYAIITKCEAELLFKIFFEVFKSSYDQETLSLLEVSRFSDCLKEFIDKEVSL